MNLKNDLEEEVLAAQLSQLNQSYSAGLEVLRQLDGDEQRLACVEKLIPLMAKVQQIEAEAELALPEVKEFIHQSEVLSQLAEQQKRLLPELIEKVKLLERDLDAKRTRTVQGIDSQHQHLQMQSAYQKRIS